MLEEQMALMVSASPTSDVGTVNASEPSDGAVVVARLSPREQEILRLVAEGCRDREIAERLFLSHHTVANHVRNILGKLDVQSRAAAISLAVRGGLI
jgi:DNA-binding NarL/FixJ family response regulator